MVAAVEACWRQLRGSDTEDAAGWCPLSVDGRHAPVDPPKSAQLLSRWDGGGLIVEAILPPRAPRHVAHGMRRRRILGLRRRRDGGGAARAHVTSGRVAQSLETTFDIMLEHALTRARARSDAR